MREVDEASYERAKAAVKVGLVAAVSLIITTVMVGVCRCGARKGCRS